jgi:hypothetical protein
MIEICNELVVGGALTKLKSQHRLRNALAKFLSVETLPPSRPNRRVGSTTPAARQPDQQDYIKIGEPDPQVAEPQNEMPVNCTLWQQWPPKEVSAAPVSTAPQPPQPRRVTVRRPSLDSGVDTPQQSDVPREGIAAKESKTESRISTALASLMGTMTDDAQTVKRGPAHLPIPAPPPPPAIIIGRHIPRKAADPFGMEWDTAFALTELCGTPVGVDDFEPSMFIFTEKERTSIRRRRNKITSMLTSTPTEGSVRIPSMVGGTVMKRGDPGAALPTEATAMAMPRSGLLSVRRSSGETPLPPSPQSSCNSSLDVDDYVRVSSSANSENDANLANVESEADHCGPLCPSDISMISVVSPPGSPCAERSSLHGPRRSSTERKKRFAPSRRSRRPGGMYADADTDRLYPEANTGTGVTDSETEEMRATIPRQRRHRARRVPLCAASPVAQPVSSPQKEMALSVSTSKLAPMQESNRGAHVTAGKSWVVAPMRHATAADHRAWAMAHRHKGAGSC